MAKGEGVSEHYGSGSSPRYVQMQGEPTTSASDLHRHEGERIFEELPRATVVEVSRPDLNDLSHIQLVYTIEIEYKQVRSRIMEVMSMKSSSRIMEMMARWNTHGWNGGSSCDSYGDEIFDGYVLSDFLKVKTPRCLF